MRIVRTLAEKVRRRWRQAVQLWPFLLRENGVCTATSLVLLDQAKIERHRSVRAGGQTVQVRTGTTDLEVVRASFSGEFAGFATIYPPDFDGLIVDAGAYIGTSAIQFALMYPKATIVCIEASPENCRLLRANTAAFPNIKAINAALTYPDGPKSVPLHDPGMGLWGLTTVAEAYGKSLPGGDEVPTITLQQILDRQGFAQIGILKMDIEGAEREILRNPDPALCNTDVLVVELHDRIQEGCTAAFETFSAGRFTAHDGIEKHISAKRSVGQMETAAP